jgi:tetratricopeptide (TPR) repeat protein
MNESLHTTQKASVETLQSNLKLNPQVMVNYLHLGWAQYGLKSYEDARETLESAVDRFPDEYEILYLLGLILKKLGDLDKAADLFLQVEQMAAKIGDQAKASMLIRFAKSQRSVIQSGDWKLEGETW